jgi:hypothetical protein
MKASDFEILEILQRSALAQDDDIQVLRQLSREIAAGTTIDFSMDTEENTRSGLMAIRAISKATDALATRILRQRGLLPDE